jgi:riboflavin kinase/FMN adenylyltransferase
MASRDIDWRDSPPASCRNGAVAIGNFDGAHLGHAALVTELVRQARRVGGPSVALTFDPHPLTLLRPGQNPPLLTTPADRAAYLQDLGVDDVLTLRTTPSLLELTAAEFFEQVVQKNLAARAMVEGPNFGFGKGREGNIDLLTRLCREVGVSLTLVPPVVLDGSEVSSSRIRAALLAGNVEEATRLLGRRYRLHGVVGVGRRRGRTIGFPTANLQRVVTVVPGAGVYAALAHVDTGRAWPAAVSIGPNPTFAEQEQKIEVHLIGFQGDLYDREIAVDFFRRLRDVRPFASVEELIAQLHRDVEEVGLITSRDQIGS